MAIGTPTQVYSTVLDNADIAALKRRSLDNDVSSSVTLLDSLQDEGLSTADAARAANPYYTAKLITYNVVVTPATTTAVTETSVEDIILDYTNGLATGADVDASAMSDAITALATVLTTDTFELSLDADPTGETTDLTIGASERAYTVTDSIAFDTPTIIPIYVDVTYTGTATTAAVIAAVVAHINALVTGADVDQSNLAAAVDAVTDVDSVTTCYIGIAAEPDAELDLTIAADEVARTATALVTATDAG
jgi:hypothetical protein